MIAKQQTADFKEPSYEDIVKIISAKFSATRNWELRETLGKIRMNDSERNEVINVFNELEHELVLRIKKSYE